MPGNDGSRQTRGPFDSTHARKRNDSEAEGACGEKASANVALGPATFRFGLQSTVFVDVRAYLVPQSLGRRLMIDSENSRSMQLKFSFD